MITINRRAGHTEGLVAHPLLKSTASASMGARRRRRTMLETIAIILIILWLLGMVSGYTLGNFIYVLLVVAIVLFLVRLISGRRV
jgi:cation transporter-like permease